MAKYIDVESLAIYYSCHTPGDDFSKGVALVMDFLDCKPPEDVKPVVHGKWIKLDMHKGMEQYKCSVCRSECYVPECMGEPMYYYCPNCGADMEKNEGGL
jgi:hypothetical protein